MTIIDLMKELNRKRQTTFIFSTLVFFFKGYGDHRDLHVLTHSFPTRRSSDLSRPRRKSRPRFSPQSDTCAQRTARRSEEHTSELQSHRRISYAVFCLKKKKHTHQKQRAIPLAEDHTFTSFFPATSNEKWQQHLHRRGHLPPLLFFF